MIKVSIIIPVYNVEKYIMECIVSIYNQTYPYFEVIIINDCSLDNSMNIINSYLNSAKKNITKVINHDKNKGLSAARNTGIANATGDYLFFVDSDDYLSNDCIETFVNLANKHNYPDIILGTTQLIPNKWKDYDISVNINTIPEYSHNIKWINKSFFIDECLPNTAWNKLIKKDYLLKYKLFFKENIIHEDNLWSWHIGNTVHSIAFNKKTTYYYRQVPNSIINKPYNTINMDSEAIIIKEMAKSIKHPFILYKLVYLLHYSHLSYCRRQGDKRLPPLYIRYPKAFLFFIKCLIMKPENLR